MPRIPELPIRDGGDYAAVEFKGLKAPGARYRDVSFSGCSFDHCSLSGAEFANCAFTECTFRTSDLSLVRLPTTRFMDTSFTDSKLMGIDWTQVDLPARLGLQVGFERCVLSHTVFYAVNLRGLRLVESTAHEADFVNADLSDAVCTGTDFSGAQFDGTTLIGADLRGATGYLIDPLKNRVRNARFSMPDAIGLLTGLGAIID